jgi:hypothetical protein
MPKSRVKIIQPTEERDTKSLAFQLMDKADEAQIIAEAQGMPAEVAEQLVYRFRDSNGKEITGLSWVGTKETAYQLARKEKDVIVIEKVEFQPDPEDKEYVLFTAYAKELRTGRTAIGFKSQWRKMKAKGAIVQNTFWFEQGASKAKRNAMQELLPVTFIKQMIAQFLKKGNVLELSAPKEIAVPTENEAGVLKPYFEKILGFKNPQALKSYEGLVITENAQNKKLSGKEMYLFRQAVAKKLSALQSK